MTSSLAPAAVAMLAGCIASGRYLVDRDAIARVEDHPPLEWVGGRTRQVGELRVHVRCSEEQRRGYVDGPPGRWSFDELVEPCDAATVNRLADTMAARYREDRAAIPADSIDGRHVDLRYRTIVSRSAADTAGRVTVEAAASNTLKSLSPILSAAGALVGGGGGALYGWGATGWDGEFAAIVEIPGALLMAVGSALLVAGVGCGIASLFHHPQETPADQQGVWRLAPAASPALDGRAPAAADGAPDGGASDRDAGTPTGGAD